MNIRDMRLDAAESVFFQRELESIDETVYKHVFPEFLSRQLVPIQPNVPDWASAYTWRMFEEYGRAKVIGNMADDLPRADANGKETTQLIKRIGASYGWDVMEIKASAALGRGLDSLKAIAARRAIESEIDDILALGNANYGLEGILNLTGAATYTLSTKALGGVTWGTLAAPNASAQEMVDDLMGIASARVEATKGAFTRFSIVLPIPEYNLAAQTPLGDNADKTVLQFVLSNSPYIEEIRPWFKAGTADSGSPRMACYPKSPLVVAGLVPMEFTPFPAQQKNLEFVVPAMGACGGVIVRYPVAVAYANGIN